MHYPVDVEKLLDQAIDKLANIRISSEKWAYFRGLAEEINAAYDAGCEGTDGYPVDVGINLEIDTEQYGLMAPERRLVATWMKAANKAYQDGCLAAQEVPVMETARIIDPVTGTVTRKVRSARDLESCLYSLIQKGRPFGLYIPGCKGSAIVEPTPAGRSR